MKYTRRWITGAGGALIVGAGLLLPATQASAAPQPLGAVALAAEEPTPVAPGDTNAWGTVDMTVDGVTGSICVRSTVSGLSGPITAAHIHTGAPGVNGPVLVPLPFGPAAVEGCVTATPAQAQSILSSPGGFYFNAHTAASPNGALRGQLTTSVYNATLTGAAESPGPGDPDGSGSAVVAVDSLNSRACVVMQVAAIDLPAAAAHIHSGGPGVAGPVVVPLSAPTAAASASCGAAAAPVFAGIIASPGNYYVNVHTAPFPNGAIRGQLAARVASGIPVPSAPTPTAAPAPGVVPTTAAVGATTTTAAVTPSTVAAPTTTVLAGATATVAPSTTVATTAVEALPTAAPAEAVTGEPSFTG